MYHEKESPLKGFRVSVNFPAKEIPMDPYTFGYKLLKSKHVPDFFNYMYISDLYKCNSKEVRLQVLAGILDYRGKLQEDKVSYDLYTECSKLTDDVIYLCRSLGFACYESTKEMFRVTINGEGIENIPVKILEKKAIYKKYINDALVYDITVKSVGVDNYYGVEIDKNKRYLLGDFTVTHNTVMAIKMAMELGLKTLVVVHKTFLLDQWAERIKQFTNARIGLIKQDKVRVKDVDIVLGMIQSISMKDYDPKIFDDIGCVIYDECIVYSQKIVTDHGNIKIGKLYEMWKNDEELPLIKSFNEITKQFEYNKITYAWNKKVSDTISIKLDDGNIECTPNHKFLTDSGYKEAQYLNQNDILVGYNNRKKICISNKCIVKNFDVYDIEVENNHNFVVITENDSGVVVHNCHHTASKIYSNSLYKTGAQYTIGLSATPFRKDGLSKVMNWYIGNPMFSMKAKVNKQVIAKIFYYKSNDPLFREKKSWKHGGMSADVVKMVSNLCELKQRSNHIVSIINELRKFPERKILLLSDRKIQLSYLKTSIDESIASDVANGLIDENECKTFMYTGDSKKDERKDAETNGDILFSTFALANEGLDIERLNTIILASPKVDIIQSVGRIMRKILKSGDVKPLIIDICDLLSVFKTQGAKREVQYKTTKYKIEHYYLKNNKVITFDDFMMQEENLTQEEVILLENRTEYVPDLSYILDMQRIEDEDEVCGLNNKVEYIENTDEPYKDSDDDSDNEINIDQKIQKTKNVIKNKVIVKAKTEKNCVTYMF